MAVKHYVLLLNRRFQVFALDSALRWLLQNSLEGTLNSDLNEDFLGNKQDINL